MPNSPNPENKKRNKVYAEAKRRLPKFNARIRKNVRAKVEGDGSTIEARANQAGFRSRYVHEMLGLDRNPTLSTLIQLSIIFDMPPEDLLKNASGRAAGPKG